MRKSIAKKFIIASTIFSMAAFASLAHAETKGRVLPTGSVTFHKNNEVIAKFTDQAPINDSALMTCDQACTVKLNTMSINAADGTTFAVRDNDGVMNLYVKEGLVTFNVSNITQQIAFYTPDGRYIKSEGFISPTSADSNVKGYMDVSKTKALIGISQGGMILATADGVQTVDEGYSYSVDLNELPATSVGAEMGKSNVPVMAGSIVIGGVAASVLALIFEDDDTPPRGRGQASQN